MKTLIAGAGPVGLTTALGLAQAGHEVVVFEASSELNASSQASTFHPSTLELLDDFDVAWDMIRAGYPVTRVQYRDRKEGLVAEFDYASIRGSTPFPVRLQLDQRDFTGLLLDKLVRDFPSVDVRFGERVTGARTVDGTAVLSVADGCGREAHHSGDVVVGADGAHSSVRRSLNIELGGSTYSQRHLMITLGCDVLRQLPYLAPVTYLFDDDETVALLTLRGVSRVVFMVPASEPEDVTLSDAALQTRLRTFLPEAESPYPILDARVASLHQRVATSFGIDRVVLAGDSAHLNHPLGGIGLNSGLHDAYYLVRALESAGNADVLNTLVEDYIRHRRAMAISRVLPLADNNSVDASQTGAAARRRRNDHYRKVAESEAETRAWLLSASLFDSAPEPRRSPRRRPRLIARI